MQLIIVESPVKSKTLQGFLGPKYRVLASYGHIRDLPKDELGVDVENNFKPKYIIPQKSNKTIQVLAEAAQKAQIVILGTDQDREGESIAWHIVQALGLDKIKNEKLKIKIKTAKKPRSIKRKLYYWGKRKFLYIKKNRNLIEIFVFSWVFVLRIIFDIINKS